MSTKADHLPLRYYTGSKLLEINEDKSEAIIEDVLFENDYIMLVAPPKMGKTILSIQMACALSSGTPFLNTFQVPKPQMVWYFATEGKDEDIKDRFTRISKLTPLNPDNIVLICSSSFRFNTHDGKSYLDYLFKHLENKLPKVIFVDALYRAIKGSLKDDKDVNEFHYIMGSFAEKCDAATVLVHHLARPMKLQDGRVADQTGEDAYGSRFLIASVDHCFSLERFKKDMDSRDRFLRCSAQRSGKIIDDVRLKLIQPDPLGFTVVSSHSEEKKLMIKYLGTCDGANVDDILRVTKLSRTVVYSVLKELQDEGKVSKEGKKMKVYRLI